MSHGVKKETYVEADERTTKALTFDILDHLGNRIDDMVSCHVEQVKECKDKFDEIDRKKKKDTAVAASSGFGGGFVAMAVYYVKNWFT